MLVIDYRPTHLNACIFDCHHYYVDIFFVAKIPENKVAKIAALRVVTKKHAYENVLTIGVTYFHHDNS